MYKGQAKSVIVPGEQGVFEVLPFHKRIMSRLMAGEVCVDERHFPIRRGLVKVDQNRVMIIIEEEA